MKLIKTALFLTAFLTNFNAFCMLPRNLTEVTVPIVLKKIGAILRDQGFTTEISKSSYRLKLKALRGTQADSLQNIYISPCSTLNEWYMYSTTNNFFNNIDLSRIKLEKLYQSSSERRCIGNPTELEIEKWLTVAIARQKAVIDYYQKNATKIFQPKDFTETNLNELCENAVKLQKIERYDVTNFCLSEIYYESREWKYLLADHTGETYWVSVCSKRNPFEVKFACPLPKKLTYTELLTNEAALICTNLAINCSQKIEKLNQEITHTQH